MTTLLVSCTVAFTIWHAGQRQTLRLNDVVGVEFADKENASGLLVNFAKDKQLEAYEILDGELRRVPANDCSYIEHPCKLGYVACPK